MISIKDIAWIAGLLEGEGYFSHPRAGNKFCATIRLAMTDRDVIDRAAVLMGAGSRGHVGVHTKPSATRQCVYGFTLHGKYAIAWMMTILPFMGDRRAIRIREAIAGWKSRPLYHGLKITCGRGHPLDHVRPDGAGRFCKTCAEQAWKVKNTAVSVQRRAAREAAQSRFKME